MLQNCKKIKMKLLYHTILYASCLLLFSSLCSGNLYNTHNHRSLHHSLLFKRDTDLHGSQSQDECREMIFGKACENGFYQDYANLLEACAAHEEARALQDGCRSQSNGKFCGSTDIFAVKRSIENGCNTTHPSPCSTTCKSTLESVRSDLGCCLKIYNDSTPPFDHNLWSTCGIEPENQECSESTVELSEPEIDQTCDGIWSTTFLQKLYSSVICSKENFESIDTKLQASKSCQDVFRMSINDMCRANELGAYCEAELSSFAKATMASGSCYKVFTCDPLCAKTLEDIINTAGCCFNHEYNDTINGRVTFEWMSQSFWAMCDLEPLGTCDAKFTFQTGHAVMLEPTKSTTVIFTIIGLLLSLIHN